ncbi:MAG: hypothetical protein JNK16_11005 [Phycisphaerales bacterium]|nr:hypothetical protein [Phycisphaerales bacterium]
MSVWFAVASLSAIVVAAPDEVVSPARAVEAWAKPYCTVPIIRLEQVGMFLPADETNSPFRVRKKATLTFRWPDAMLEVRSQQWVMPDGDAIPLDDQRMPASAVLRLESPFLQVIAPSGTTTVRFDDGSVDKKTQPVSFAEVSRAYLGVTPWVAAHYVCDMKPQNLRVERVDGRIFVHLDAENARLEFSEADGGLLLDAIERRKGETDQLAERVEFREYQRVQGVPFLVPKATTVYAPLVIYNERARKTSDGPVREEGTGAVVKFETPASIEDSFFVLPPRDGGRHKAFDSKTASPASPPATSVGPVSPDPKQSLPPRISRAVVDDSRVPTWWWVGGAGVALVVAGVVLRIRRPS